MIDLNFKDIIKIHNKIILTEGGLEGILNLKTYKKISDIFDAKWLTNSGNQHAEFKKCLLKFLNAKNINLFCNGTLALDIAIKALDIKGEVITTPFTFAATPHVLSLNNIRPVFCDIDEKTLNIDVEKIEALITPKTSAILAVHVFGNPCDIEKLDKICKKYKLKLIFDAAHAFGVKINEKSIGSFGDISMFSFHATKAFNSIEGGCLMYNDSQLNEKIQLLKNFGIKNENEIAMIGTNAKLNELQAAFGILNLKIFPKEIEKRQKIARLYRKISEKTKGIKVMQDIKNVKHNYSYFPILINKEEFGISRDDLYLKLKKYNIFSRKYFYPLCSNFSCYAKNNKPADLPIANKIADSVLCLPIHGDLKTSDVEKICKIITIIKNEK